MKRIIVKPTRIIGQCPLGLTAEDEFQIEGMSLENPKSSKLCFLALTQLPTDRSVWQRRNEERFSFHISCPGCTSDPDHENCVVFMASDEAGDGDAQADVTADSAVPGEIPVAHDQARKIRPVTQNDLAAIFAVYRQCEDFLALGPVPTASTEMVLKDLEISQSEGGNFCGIYAADGQMIGVVDYIPCDFEGDPSQAFISLLMIARPFRMQGIGSAVVAAIEEEIKKNEDIRVILSGVQVNNPDAIRFWENREYFIVGGPEEMPDQTTAYRLQKDLYEEEYDEEYDEEYENEDDDEED